MVTTGFQFEGYEIVSYLGIVAGEVVLGTGFLSEFTSSFADFFGVQSGIFEEKLETARHAAMDKLIKNQLHWVEMQSLALILITTYFPII